MNTDNNKNPTKESNKNELLESGNNEDVDLFDSDEEDFEFSNAGGQVKEDDEFDQIVGALQDVVIDTNFEQLQNDFLDKNCMIFEEDEENKMEYMIVFKDYQKTLESYIEKKLKEALPNYDMARFQNLLKDRVDQIDPQLLDMLLTFTDFELFKEHILSFKKLTMSKKKKSKKFEEFKKEQPSKPQTTSKQPIEDLDQDFSDLMISGSSKIIVPDQKPKESNKSKQKQVQPKAPEKKTTAKAQPGSQNFDDIPLYTPKKTVTKANEEYKPSKKDNIFS